MAVSLDIFDKNGESTDIWRRFLNDSLDTSALSLYSHVTDNDDIIRKRYNKISDNLVKFNAWTDMDNRDDPIWFQDEESKTYFLLVWG